MERPGGRAERPEGATKRRPRRKATSRPPRRQDDSFGQGLLRVSPVRGRPSPHGRLSPGAVTTPPGRHGAGLWLGRSPVRTPGVRTAAPSHGRTEDAPQRSPAQGSGMPKTNCSRSVPTIWLQQSLEAAFFTVSSNLAGFELTSAAVGAGVELTAVRGLDELRMDSWPTGVTSIPDLGQTLHPAVGRPGRCAANIEFEPLRADEASRWLEEHGRPSEAGGQRSPRCTRSSRAEIPPRSRLPASASSARRRSRA